MKYFYFWMIVFVSYAFFPCTSSGEKSLDKVVSVGKLKIANMQYSVSVLQINEQPSNNLDSPLHSSVLVSINSAPTGKEIDAGKTLLLENVYGTEETLQGSMEFCINNILLIELFNSSRPDNEIEMFMIDLNNASLQDRWCCRAPSISPSKEFIVFEKSMATHGMEICTKVLLYDIKKTLTERRKIPSNERSITDIGYVLFPPQHARLQEYEIQEEFIPGYADVYLINSEFLWSPKSDYLIFLTALLNECTYVVSIKVPISREGIIWGQRKVEFTEDMVRDNHKEDFFKKKEQHDKILMYLNAETISWGKTGELQVFSTSPNFFKSPIVLGVPDCSEKIPIHSKK